MLWREKRGMRNPTVGYHFYVGYLGKASLIRYHFDLILKEVRKLAVRLFGKTSGCQWAC